jgi:hypothetical protein
VDDVRLDVVGVIISVVVALGAGSVTAWTLVSFGDLAGKLRRFLLPRSRISLRSFFQEQETPAQERDKLPRNLFSLASIPAGIALAILARDWLLSPYLVVVGIGLSFLLRSKQGRREQAAMTNQVKALVLLFRSRFSVGESPFAVLADVLPDLPEGQVKKVVHRAVDTYRARGDIDEALTVMRELRNPYLSRLVMILDASGSAETETILDELKDLEGDLKSRDRLAGQARATLALLKGTVSFLQVANLTAVVASVALPLWHDFFTSTLQRRGTFLAATMFLLVASVFFDQESSLQEDKVL